MEHFVTRQVILLKRGRSNRSDDAGVKINIYPIRGAVHMIGITAEDRCPC